MTYAVLTLGALVCDVGVDGADDGVCAGAVAVATDRQACAARALVLCIVHGDWCAASVLAGDGAAEGAISAARAAGAVVGAVAVVGVADGEGGGEREEGEDEGELGDHCGGDVWLLWFGVVGAVGGWGWRRVADARFG